MRQLFLEKGLIAIKEVCEPLLSDDMVLVQVHYSCISPGTEGATINSSKQPLFSNIHSKIQKVLSTLHSHGIQGTRTLIQERLSGQFFSMGYSVSGIVIGVGKNIKKLRVGDMVACAGAGYASHAEFVVVPEKLVTLVQHKEFLRDASTATLGAIALQGLRRAQLQLGESVAVIGLGLLGQLTVQLAKKAGNTVFGIDLVDDRLQLARTLGADFVYNAQNLIEAEIAAATLHEGVDVTIITASSTSNAIIQQAMQITRKKGRVVLVGDVGLHIERDPLYAKEIDFLISCSYGPGRYDSDYEQRGIDYPYAYVRWTENRNLQTIVSMIENKSLRIEPLIAKEMPLDMAESAYKELEEKKALAIILSYTAKKPAQTISESKKIKQPPKDSAIRLGVIGAGGFTKMKLLPIVSKIPNISIKAIVDPNNAYGLTTAKLYGAAHVLTNDHQLFEKDLIDAVIIASPHKYHSAQALEALRNGKSVFLEKPMVTDFEQLKLFKECFLELPHINFCVDYNRSFAPLIQKIKNIIKKRSGPLMILYRMNAGLIPKNHWIQQEVGAGRIIGEACHIVDLFYMLTDAQVRSISVEALRPLDDNYFPTDNFSVSCNFSDGSVCTLLYTALGHSSLPKERMELFFDGKVLVLDDYHSLKGYGISCDMRLGAARKGHEELMHLFFEGLHHQTAQQPISLQRLEQVAETTLIIDQLVCNGGGTKDIAHG